MISTPHFKGSCSKKYLKTFLKPSKLPLQLQSLQEVQALDDLFSVMTSKYCSNITGF